MSKPPRTEKPAKGRPPGSKTQERPTVDVQLSRCPKCGSTERTHRVKTREIEFAGTMRDGTPYTHIVWYATTCANESCRQVRADRVFENRK